MEGVSLLAKMFIGESSTKEIIKRLYHRNKVAGLICELCWLRNFRVGDVRFAQVTDFRKNNGHAEFYLRDDKTQTNEWYPIPDHIYKKINLHIIENKLKPDDFVFKIKMLQKGRYYLHEGIITHEWIQKLWFNICRKIDIYKENPMTCRYCSKCKYAVAGKRCKVYGWDKLKNRSYVHIKQCIDKGKTMVQMERHPRLHETLRGSGAKNKVLFYINKGKSYEEALLKVFNMSNWRSWKVFKEYMDMAFEKEIGDNTFIKDFGDKILIEN